MKGIIFDMDGTIINSSNAICKTINQIRQNLNLNQLDDNYILKIINEPNKNLIKELYNLETVNLNLKNEFEHKFKINYALYASIYDGIKDMLDDIKAQDYKIALASNAPSNNLKEILKSNNILDYFDYIVGVDDNIPPKPNPFMLNLVIKELSLQKSVFVGDSKNDELAAISANIPYINVLWGSKSKSDFYNVEKPSEILNLVKEINND